MATLNIFQRYSQKENTVTNNILLLFSRIYEISPKIYNEFIVSILEVENAYDVLLRFEQQIKTKSGRIPDGIISLKSSAVLIETKLESTDDFAQLHGHCSKFENEDYQILILITKTPLRDAKFEKAKAFIQQDFPKVKFFSIAHSDIIAALEKLVKEYPFKEELNTLFVHYANYCEEEELLPNEEFLLRAVPCGPSWELNEKHHFYFDDANRGFRRCRYLGFYWGKAVRAIGEIELIVEADLVDGKLLLKDNGKLTDEEVDAMLTKLLADEAGQ